MPGHSEAPGHSHALWSTILSKRMGFALLMGFYSGLPLLLTGALLQAWLKDSGTDLTMLGAVALLGLPYTLKFLWAPLVDRYSLFRLGRRRGWLIVSQLLLSLSIAALGMTQPAHAIFATLAAALCTSFFSATQDIVIDAYRRENLLDREQGLGAALYVNGYRFAMLLVGGGGLILADFVGFRDLYLLAATLMFSSVLVTLAAPEPKNVHPYPATLKEAVLLPLLSFFARRNAWVILAFIVLYKLGDTLAGQMTIPFYLTVGFSKTEIGMVVKLFGFWATLLGSLLGGVLVLRGGLYVSLWVFGVLQGLSTACFALLLATGPSQMALAAVVSFENLSAGMGSAAFTAFMAIQSDQRYTATQYALLSSLMGVPRVFAAAPSGWLVEQVGWQNFFLSSAMVAVPGLLMLAGLKPVLR
ncbi:MAG: MFS transporter [Methylococcaceae bacterium]|nr:MAG: MFS transporter [Methylococcaceae bacterium]